MKKTLLTVISSAFMVACLFAQAPQSICYQAAAKNNQGVDMIDQNITIRAAILRGSPTGVVEWEETHSPTTDQFGLFTINVGEGSPTGNGAQQNFDLIDWGNGTYYLRIGMDPFGGSNFTTMGVTQIISVPYALYANEAGNAETADQATTAAFADTAAVAQVAEIAVQAQNAMVSQTTLQAVTSDTALYAHVAATSADDMDKDPTNELQSLQMDGDTLQLVDANGNVTPGAEVTLGDNSSTNEIQMLDYNNGTLSISGGNAINLTSGGMFSAPGASADFPQGIVGGDHVILLDQLYTVPDGKILYVTAGSPNLNIQGYGFPANGFTVHPTTPNMPIFPSGTQVSNCFCTGFLLDELPEVTAVIIDLTTTAGYSVPPNTVLFVKSGIPNDLPGRLIVDDQEMEFFRPNLTRGSRIVCFPGGVLLKKPALYNELVLTGYLIPD